MSNNLQNSEAQGSEHTNLEQRFDAQGDSGVFTQKEKGAFKESTMEQNIAEDDTSYQNILSKVKSDDDDDDDETLMQDASNLHKQTDRESQIIHLIDLAMTKGVKHAVKVAQKAEDYYVLDQLHDRLLSDDLHDALLSKDLIND